MIVSSSGKTVIVLGKNNSSFPSKYLNCVSKSSLFSNQNSRFCFLLTLCQQAVLVIDTDFSKSVLCLIVLEP